MYLGCATNQRTSPSASSESTGSFVFYGVLTAELVDGEGDKAAGDMTTVHVQTLLQALSDMSLITCFMDEAFFLKQTSSLGTTLLRLLDVKVKELCFIS
jgi:hypothetical protein